MGNTPGNMEKEALELVLKELAVSVMAEKQIDGPLVIEQCNLLSGKRPTKLTCGSGGPQN